MAKVIWLFLLLGVLEFGVANGQDLAVQESTQVDISKDPKLNALRWMQNAAEYQILTKQAYRLATFQLNKALDDPSWTADEVQARSEDYQTKKPAIILDVDETVLDNSPFNARNILDGKPFSLATWNDWCNEAQARAVPGALKFIQGAKEKGVEVFYVTNRRDVVRTATLKNLKALGFPGDEEHLLTRNDDQGRGGDKVSRRAMVAEKHRIILLIGDNMSDLCSGMDVRDQAERNRVAAQKEKMLGARWILLPNPVYGGWERALNRDDDNLDPARK